MHVPAPVVCLVRLVSHAVHFQVELNLQWHAAWYSPSFVPYFGVALDAAL